jgi:hypothetical protein
VRLISEEMLATTQGTFSAEEIFCIARHMQRYAEVFIHEDPDFPDPCNLCPQSPDCVKTKFRLEWDTLLKLKDITGVDMGPMKKKTSSY